MSDSGKHDASHDASHDTDTSDSPRLPPGMHDAFRFAGAGMELGGSAIACAVIGYAIDRYFENETMIVTALGAIFGFAGGMFRFIKLALAASRESKQSDNKRRFN